MIGKLRIAWVLLLALAAGPAFALGLGQIEVRSQRDQPLLAEIPIISSDPSELEQLQARLASPDTFARIGLEPPQGVVSDLQFTIALDGQGRPVIRVTSAAPVQQPLLTFLVEVDWGQGRLVREYSALLDAPRTVSAPAQPLIQAPTVAAPNTIVRPEELPAVAVQEGPAATPGAPTPIAATPAAPSPAPAPESEPSPPATTIAPTPAPVAAAPIATPAPEAQAGDTSAYGPVKRGETLGQIAGSVGSSGYSLDQTMLALLQANPDAFIGGNVNLIKQGAVLRVPAAGEVARLGADEAAAAVHDQIQQWRAARQPAPQPAAIAGAATAMPGPAARPARNNNPPRIADARLEIVPPSTGSARRAGTRSGIEAGGEGDMLRQELQQTKETLAARESEATELKSRVAELEKLQQQQQQLITLKDNELAAAQQRLAAASQPAPVAAAKPVATTQATPAGDQGNVMVWVWGGVALVVLALLVGWFSRRKHPTELARSFSVEAMAASIPAHDDQPFVESEAVADIVKPVKIARPAKSAKPAKPAKPTFVDIVATGDTEPAPPTPAPAWNASAAIMPTWHADASAPAPAASTITASTVASPPAGHDRIELARAYIDLGDVDTARNLLQEVANSGDAATRSEASRLLRELA